MAFTQVQKQVQSKSAFRKLSGAGAIMSLAVIPAASLMSGRAWGATDTWNSTTTPSWNTVANWTGGNAPPVSGDLLVFGGTTFVTSPVDDMTGLTVNGITFSAGASAYTLTTANGVELLLGTPFVSGTTASGNITNSSSAIQTIGMDVRFGVGNHGVAGGANGTTALAFNPVGGFLRNTAATTVFSGTVTTNTVTNGNGGIIGGDAVVGTNWATVSGGSIVALSSYTDITTTGTIASNGASNVRINSGTAGTANVTVNTDINTLMLNVDSIAETVNIASGSTLRFGAIGGIFRTGTSNTTNALQITGGTVTAGGADGVNGKLVLNGGNGNGTGTFIVLGSTVTDNAGGVVTLVKTGRGYASVSNTSNSYTGGTYINEGRLSGTGLPTGGGSLGTGDITVASGGELLGGGTFTNNVYIAGIGPQNEAGNGAIRGGTFNGPMFLTADASVSSATINGQITGNFGLSFGALSNAGGSGTTATLGNTASNNAWTGNTTIVGRTNGTGTSTLRLAASEQIPDGSTLVVGNAGINSGSTLTFDLAGFNETVAGLTSVGGSSTSQIVTNSGASADSNLTLASTGGTFNGAITSGASHTINLTLNGGTEILTGASTYTGTTTVNGGALVITGSLGATAVTVNSGATLGGTGGIGGTVTVAAGGHVAPGANVAAGTIGTLTVAGLNVSGDLQTDLGTAGPSDAIVVNGPVSFTGSPTISVTGGVVGNSYAVVQSNGAISYGATPTLVAPSNPLIRPTVYSLDTTTNPNVLAVNVVSGGAATLTWSGNNNGNWDINTTMNNWQNSGATSDVFYNNDNVTFGDGPTNRNITISGTVQPGSVLVNNSAGNTYTFSGGAIGGSTGLVKSGTGLLVLTNNNTYTGATTINAGTLQVGNGGTSGTLGSGTVTDNGNLVFDRSDAISVATVIGGSGTVTIGDGTTAANVTITGVPTYTGGTVVSKGSTLTISTTGSIATSSGVTLDGGTEVIFGTPTAKNFGTGTTNVTANGGTIQYGATTAVAGNAINIASGPGLTIDIHESSAKTTFTNAGAITGSGPLSVINSGTNNPDTYQLSGNNSGYTGNISVGATGVGVRLQPTTVNGLGSGSVTVGNNSQVFFSTAGTYANTFNITGIGSAADSPNQLYGAMRFANGGANNTNVISGTINLTGDATISVGTNATNTTSLTGQITGAHTLKLISGIFTMNGTVANYGPTAPGSVATVLGRYDTSADVGPGTAIVGSPAGISTGGMQFDGGSLVLNGQSISVNNLSTAAGSTGAVATPAASNGVTGNTWVRASSLTNVSTGNAISGVGIPANTYVSGTATQGSPTVIASTSSGTTLNLTSAAGLVGLVVGDSITGTNIQPGTTITGITTGATPSITISQSLTANLAANTTMTVATGPVISLTQALTGSSGSTVSVIHGSSIDNNGPAASGTTATLTFGGDGTSQTYNGVVVDGASGGTVALKKVGSGVQTMGGANSYSGGTSINGGTIVAANVQALGTGAVAVHAGAGLQLQGGLAKAVVVPLLTVDNAASVDLTNDKLIVQDSVTHATSVANLQAAAHSVLTSSTMAANYGIAVIDNGALAVPFTTFGGQTADVNSILVSPELLGDANADGNVDGTDLNAVLNNFGASTLAWTSGNFDGAPTIDLTDLAWVLNNFGLHNSNASAIAGGSVAQAAPEPTSLAMAGLGAAALLMRRRKA